MPHNIKASIEAYVRDNKIDLTQQELSDLIDYLSDRSITPTNAGLNLRTGGKIKNVTVALNARSYNYTAAAPAATAANIPVVPNQPAVVGQNTPLTNVYLNHMKTLKNPVLHYKPLTAQQKAAAAIRAIQQKYAPAPAARKSRKSRKNRKTRKARKSRKSA